MPAMILPVQSAQAGFQSPLAAAVMDARSAVHSVVKALADASPNGRDYYVRGPGALTAAIDERRAYFVALTQLADELLWLACPDMIPAGGKSMIAALTAATSEEPSVLPTVHNNGTSARELTSQAERVVTTAEAAAAAIFLVAPDPAFYRPEDFAAASAQHIERVELLRRLTAFAKQLVAAAGPAPRQ